jgi:hypothetical protein
MLSRVAFALITLFWLVMNVWLWRAEYGGKDTTSGPVPVEVVWRKMMTAPDSSSLTIFYQGQKVGFCHWTTAVGEEFARLKGETVAPEGMVQKIGGYRIQVEGNLVLQDFRNRIRFEGQLRLATNQAWEELGLRVNMRPASWEVRSVAEEKTATLRVMDADGEFKRVFKFAELRNPEALVQEAVGPLGMAALEGMGWTRALQNLSASGETSRWEARREVVKLGLNTTRAYRLQARFLNAYQAVFLISRVGEILRIELPNGIILANDQLANQ